jgi:hypothetical protein
MPPNRNRNGRGRQQKSTQKTNDRNGSPDPEDNPGSDPPAAEEQDRQAVEHQVEEPPGSPTAHCSDSRNGKRPPILKESPFVSVTKKPKASPSPSKTKTSETVGIIRVTAGQGKHPIPGFVVIPKMSWAGKLLCQNLYVASDAPHYARRNKLNDLEALGCFEFVFNAIDKDGDVIQRLDSSNTPRDLRALVWPVGDIETVTEENMNKHLVNRVHPVISRNGSIDPNKLPLLKAGDIERESCWRTVDTWDQALPEDKLEKLISFIIPDDMTPYEYMREDPAHMYNIFQEGTITEAQISRLDLPFRYLRDEDKKNCAESEDED